MATVIITEKSSQARDLRMALGNRFGQILPAEGHLLRLAEPDEVNPEWKRWTTALLKPDGLYPTKPDTYGNKQAKFQAIVAALKGCDKVILATDCDREGQLIGQEILEHVGFRGNVMRAIFTAQDPKTIRDAFERLKPNTELRPIYEAAVARQQADQIFNLSLTRTATTTLRAPGSKTVIGIGRVKTPTLAIVCMRELEIVNFKPEDYFEIVATATVENGAFLMRHAPPPKDRIKDKKRADAIAQAAEGCKGPLAVTVEEKRQGPPRLFDLPALQKTCGQRWGWNADKTLSVAQELYDGDGKKLITYPRAEARYLSENQIDDVPAIVRALTGLRGFAHLDISRPVIRKGKSGHFCDKALEGVSHHAIVPNVNVLGDLEPRLARLSDDEKRLFALICRSYLAVVMPDYEYRQTTVTMPVPMPEGKPVEFRTIGRVPIRLGWKEVYTGAEQSNQPEPENEQTLPPIKDGDIAALSDAKVEAKRTQPPPRYNEGTLIDAMQNAWRFVEDPALRDRLKEAKGIGTPATRAEVIKGLKRQNMLVAEGKLVVPTEAGLHLFELLRTSAPVLVDPGTTAVWEMKLDEIVTGRAEFRTVIDGIATEADRLIGALRQRSGAKLDLGAPTPSPSVKTKGRAKAVRKPRVKAAAKDGETPEKSPTVKRRRSPARRKQTMTAAPVSDEAPKTAEPRPGRARGNPPTEKMLNFAKSIAERRGIELSPAVAGDFDACRTFLDLYAKTPS